MIIIIIFLQASFSAFQDWSSNKIMSSIRNMIPNSASVIRDGVEHKIPVEDVVIGDLVHLSYGNKVPADVRIIESHDLKFDKSMLTGESEAVEGTIECTDDRYLESKNIAFMTTLITNGQGIGVVVQTGAQTAIGNIANMVSKANEKATSLQEELNSFIFKIVCFAVITASILLIIWAGQIVNKHPNYITLPYIMVSIISVVVGFIPEGLPVCVTLSLLIIAKRMAKRRVLVKNLSVIETLSCVNVIASDKTGTLTQNKMFVNKISNGLETIDINKLKIRSNSINKLLGACLLCNNAKFQDSLDNESTKQKETTGNATDIALLRFSTEFLDLKDLRMYYTTINEIPFNSKNKWMMKIVKPNDMGIHESIFNYELSRDESMMMLKGAPDILLKKCSSMIDQYGNEIELTNKLMNGIIKLQNDWCLLGERVLLICIKKTNFSMELIERSAEELVNLSDDFCLVGLIGLIDPPREGISDVVSKCRKAGIRVVMLTGNKLFYVN